MKKGKTMSGVIPMRREAARRDAEEMAAKIEAFRRQKQKFARRSEQWWLNAGRVEGLIMAMRIIGWELAHPRKRGRTMKADDWKEGEGRVKARV